jgi:hypothetical protein
MSLALRHITWLDGTILADDYDVTHDGEIAGRVYRIDRTDRKLWRWMQSDPRAGRTRRRRRSGDREAQPGKVRFL